MISFRNNPMQRVFNAMQCLVHSPVLAFFQRYRNDFDEHDRREICDWGSPAAEWIWVVREHGTHLVQLGISDRQDEYLRAVLKHVASDVKADPARAKLFHVSGTGQVLEVGVEAISQLVARPVRYSLLANVLARHCADGSAVPIARSRLIWERGFARQPQAVVAFDTVPGYQPTAMQRWNDIAVMRVLAIDIVVDDTGSLLTGVSKLLLDGQNYEDLFLTARQHATKQPEDQPSHGFKRRSSTPNNRLCSQPSFQRNTQC